MSGRKVAGAIRSLVTGRGIQLECTRVFHGTLFVHVLMYCSDTMIWKKGRSRIRAEKMDNLRGLLGIKRMDKVTNAQIRELCGVNQGVDERIDEGALQWFGHVERMENDRNAKRVCW